MQSTASFRGRALGSVVILILAMAISQEVQSMIHAKAATSQREAVMGRPPVKSSDACREEERNALVLSVG